MKRTLRYIAAPALSAILLTCGFPPLHLHYLAWFALVPLLWSCHGQSPRQAAVRFFLAGWIFHALLLNWFAANVFWAGFRALIGWQLLSISLALYWAVLGAVLGWFSACFADRPRPGRLPRALIPGPELLALPFFWVVMEWAQATLFTGFGWSALGYTQTGNPYILQWAAVGGVGLLGFFIVAVNGLLAEALRARKVLAMHALTLLLLMHAISRGTLLIDPPIAPDRPTAAIFQSSFPQLMKWDNTYLVDMVRQSSVASLATADREKVDLIVWPEALVMADFRKPVLFNLLQETARKSNAHLFTGTVRDGDGGDHFNASVLLNPDGEVVDTYDKIHLAPFGEYVPFARYWPLLDNLVPGGAMDAGRSVKVLDAGDLRLGPLICFEVLFGPMAERLRREGADALVVITNLGWFGFSAGVDQELQVARMRAVETRLPVIHAANTGVSAVIDPWGRVNGPNAMVDLDGQYYRWRTDPPAPINTLMQRMLAVHPVPPAAHRPFLSIPPHITPRVCLAVALAVLAVALRRRRKLEPANAE